MLKTVKKLTVTQLKQYCMLDAIQKTLKDPEDSIHLLLIYSMQNVFSCSSVQSLLLGFVICELAVK